MRRALVVMAAVLATVGGDSGLTAQADSAAAAAPVSPYLAPDHWTVGVLRRLEALGLIGGGFDPALPGAMRSEAAVLLERALDGAAESRPALVPLIRGWLDRLRAEYPAAVLPAESSQGWRPGGARAAAGMVYDNGALLTSVGTPPLTDEDWIGWVPDVAAEHGDTRRGVIASVDASAYAGPSLALEAGVAARPGGVDVTGQVVAGTGRVRAWLGRRRLKLGYAETDIVLTGAEPMTGGGLAVAPFRLPWVLGRIGDIRVATALSRLGTVAPHDHPWLWLMRLSAQPHDRLVLGLNRGAMAIAAGGGAGTQLKQLAYIFIGKHGHPAELDWLDNQVLSLDIRYRPPTGPLPLMLYLEWGMEDTAGAWRDVPGILFDASLAAVPGAPWLSAGFGHTRLMPQCCGNPWWYRHTGFQGGWTDDRRPLGVPLAGEGDEWTGRVGAALFAGRGDLEARAYRRSRGRENLYAPTFQGTSLGGALDYSGLIGSSAELSLGFEYEHGSEDWTRYAARLSLAYLF